MLSDSQRAALSARLRRRRDTSAPGRITRRPAGLEPLPASFGQEQLWFLDRFAPGRTTYNVPCPVRLRGQLDAGAMSRAVDGLLARHEALRTRLVTGGDGSPVQVVDPPPHGVLDLLDYSEAGPDVAWQRLRQLASDQMQRPFTLAGGRLMRAQLVRLADDEHVLMFVVHHAVFDGWSAGVLVQDVAALYAAQVTGEPPDLAELRVQFADYAVWERDRLQGDAQAELERYWQKSMAGFQILQLATDRPRPAVNDFAGGQQDRVMPADLLRGLQELSRREGTTLFVTLMAALQALLSRYTGQSDVVVGTTSANRSRGVLAPLIGYLINTLPIRCDLSGDPAFTEVLARVRDATLGAFAHQDLPFARLVEALQVERDASRAPVIQLMFNLVDVPDEAAPMAAGVRFEPLDQLDEASTSKFDVSLFAFAGEQEFKIGVVYASALFDAVTVERLLGNFEVLLAGVVADPGVRLSGLPVLTAGELDAEVAGWNETGAEFPLVCLHEGFEAQVARTPDGVAVELGGERVSYGELNRQANQVARWLRGAGVGPEVLVGVCMAASPRRLAVLLGVLKAGGGYVPLDPGLPAGRVSFMVADAGLGVVLADDWAVAGLPPGGAVLLGVDAQWPVISGLEDGDLADAGVVPSDVAYVIYTSGSTGQPKGVVVEHRQAVNFAYGMVGVFGIGPADAVLQFASLSFDVSVMDMFVPLLAGGRVVLVPPETLRSPPRLAALMQAAGVTYACLTPSVLNLLTGYDFPGLRSLVSGGEELPSELARAWLRPGLGFWNTYGPTEAAVVTTFTILDAGTQMPPPIGRPLPNYRAYVLDGYLNPVPVGVVGELHIGGAGVARGYLNRPALTSERFIADPFSGQGGARMYKSGDLVRRRGDGSIVFAGRADGQVKIRGLRIELGEIETALAAQPGVAQAVVTVVTDPAGEKQLAGYLRPEPGTEPDLAGLRFGLAQALPDYMIPAYLVTVDSFALNASGKIDKSALPAPQAPAQAGHVLPATLIEIMMADMYATLLKLEQVGATDSFFEIGGSSLQAMRLISMMADELEVDIGVAEVFLAPTPRQLAALLRDKHGLDDAGLDADDAERLQPGPAPQEPAACPAGRSGAVALTMEEERTC
jgi:amino acid adenylation domain-containing protein